jgi:hypothetical protein
MPNNKPTQTPTAGYVSIQAQSFPRMNPNTLAYPIAIPKTNNGNTQLGMFNKISSLLKSPLPKKVINTQQQRF